MGELDVVPDASFDLLHQPVDLVSVFSTVQPSSLTHGRPTLATLRTIHGLILPHHHTFLVVLFTVVEEAVPIADELNGALPIGGLYARTTLV